MEEEELERAPDVVYEGNLALGGHSIEMRELSSSLQNHSAKPLIQRERRGVYLIGGSKGLDLILMQVLDDIGNKVHRRRLL